MTPTAQRRLHGFRCLLPALTVIAALLAPVPFVTTACAAPAPPADTLRTAFEKAVRSHDGPTIERLIRARPTLSRDAVSRTVTAYLEEGAREEIGLARFVAERHAAALGDSFFVRLVDRIAAMNPKLLAQRRAAAAAYRDGQERSALGAYPEAGVAFRRSLALARGSADPYLEAEARNEMGKTAYAMGQLAEAESQYRTGLALAKRGGDRELVMHLERNLGLVLMGQGDEAGADSSFGRALADARLLGDDAMVARSLNDLAGLAGSAGRVDDAIELLTEALPLVGDRAQEGTRAQILRNLALLTLDAGDPAGGLRLFDEALASSAGSGDRAGEARTLAALGQRLVVIGDPGGALGALSRALSVLQSGGDRASVPPVLLAMGDAYFAMGEPGRAAGLHARARAAALDAASPADESAALSRLARDARALGLADSALACASAAAALSRRASSSRALAIDLADLGALLLEGGRREDAAAAFRDAAERARSVGFLRGEGWATLGLGLVEARGGDPTAAADLLGRAEALGRSAGDPALAVEAAARLAAASRAPRGMGAPEAGWEHAIALLDSTAWLRRDDATAPLLQRAAAAIYEEAALEVSPDGGAQNAAPLFPFVERARMARAATIWNRWGGPVLGGFSPATRQAEAGLWRRGAIARKRLDAASREEHPDAAALASLTSELDGISRERASILRKAEGEDRARVAALGLAVPTTLLDAKAALAAEKTILLEYLLGAERGVLLVLDAGGETAFPVKAGRGEIGAAVAGLRAGLSQETPAGGEAAAARADSLASALFTTLLGPVADRLQRGARVVIVADGPLELLPFAALRPPPEGGPERRLVEKVTLALSPSATYYESARAPRPDAERLPSDGGSLVAVAAFGNPSLTAAPRSLSYARPAAASAPPSFAGSANEAEAVAAILHGEAVVGPEATEARLRSAAPRARVLHLALPGTVEDERGLASGLSLTSGGPGGANTDDGRLEASEVASLPCAAGLVLLTRCGAEAGAGMTGWGALAFRSAWLACGPRTLLVASWAAPDEAGANFASKFLRAMGRAGGDAPGALADVQRAALASARRRGAPNDGASLWASFAIVGGRRVPWRAASPPAVLVAAAGAGVLIVILATARTRRAKTARGASGGAPLDAPAPGKRPPPPHGARRSGRRARA